ncbi:MarR family transcriptional regulator [Sedimentibacter sp. zth1]|uniref:MarR family winged helix-turn-helix transcriptional regulator n=1 Tax=Sedimentibacter sp. zth1 TaxID=2816908 RepID=UPI001A90DDF2|nr:MarR family transcriptional regulator [Sedimentibacter sp. zth1]QSX05509.1 MarR family transcriptional regulator [Sedimentibacter sp. zth1]
MVNNFKNFENFESMQHAVQLARMYNLSCRWASLKQLNIVNILIMVELYADEKGVEASQIADHLFLPRQTMTYAVDSLEQKNYVIRKSHPSDRRRKLLVLTPQGYDLVTGIMSELDEEFNNFTKELIPDKTKFYSELDEFILYLEKKMNEYKENYK